MVMLEVYLPRSEVTLRPMWVAPQIVNRRCFMLKITVGQKQISKAHPQLVVLLAERLRGKSSVDKNFPGRGTAQEDADTGKILFSKEKRAPWCSDMVWRRRTASFSHENALGHSSEMLFTVPYSPLPLPHPGQSHFRELTTPHYLAMALPS